MQFKTAHNGLKTAFALSLDCKCGLASARSYMIAPNRLVTVAGMSWASQTRTGNRKRTRPHSSAFNSRNYSAQFSLVVLAKSSVPGLVMTPDQQKQFNRFGCIARCIIKLAELKNHPITEGTFCDQFNDLFLIGGQYGLLLTSQIVRVIGELHLGQHFQCFRRYCEIDSLFNNEHRSILVFSEININETATDLVKHCSLLLGINHQEFKIWTPLNDGSDQEVSLNVNLWEAKACHGLVLLP